MNHKEILLIAEAVSNEKGVPREVIFEALEAALSSAARENFTITVDARVQIDRKTGMYQTFRQWQVVEDDELFEPSRQITLSAAREGDPEIQIGDIVEDEIENAEFKRVTAQKAKQVIIQKVREAERAQVVNAFVSRIGEMITGTIKRADRGNVLVDLGEGVEAIILREDVIPREPTRVGERIRAYIRDVRLEHRGPQIFLSRTMPEFLIQLFQLEVPEISQGSIEIIAAARDPGVRAKVVVKSHDQRIDPVGACVGMRGARIQSVVDELAGERIDIVLWNENPVEYVINAMAPAEVKSVVLDEDLHAMEIAVPEEKLSQAIGRGGQNVRLASEVTGWRLNVISASEAAAKTDAEAASLAYLFIEGLGVDEEIAEILLREGFSSLEEVAYVPIQEMLEIEEFDEEIVDVLRAAAVEALQKQQTEGGVTALDPALLMLEGMNTELAQMLAQKGIATEDDLAELAVDELMELCGIDEPHAAQLIMAARASWFAEGGA